jgi:hypothetical protein
VQISKDGQFIVLAEQFTLKVFQKLVDARSMIKYHLMIIVSVNKYSQYRLTSENNDFPGL